MALARVFNLTARKKPKLWERLFIMVGIRGMVLRAGD